MYNVGDEVIIRSWHEVAKARGQEKGKIYCEAHCVYDFSMNDYAGKTAVIDAVAEVHEHEGAVEFFYRLVSESGELLPHRWTDSMLVPREAAAKQTDGAAEEKFADRPQILKGDIVRFISALTGEENVDVVRCENTKAYFNSAFGEVIAVYRFDGLNFKCIWESAEYQLRKFDKTIKIMAKFMTCMVEDWKDVIAALKRMDCYAKEAGDGKHGSEKAD